MHLEDDVGKNKAKYREAITIKEVLEVQSDLVIRIDEGKCDNHYPKDWEAQLNDINN